MNQLEQQLSEALQHARELASANEDLQAQVRVLEEAIETQKKETRRHENRADLLDTDNDGLRDRIGELETDLDRFQEQIDGVEQLFEWGLEAGAEADALVGVLRGDLAERFRKFALLRVP